jgi:hypothetical protein
MLYSGRLSLRSPSGERLVLLSSTQLRCSFETVSRSAPFLTCLSVIRCAAYGGPDAISGGFVEACQPSRALERFFTSVLDTSSLNG